jgi:serine/threonine-protein kinase
MSSEITAVGKYKILGQIGEGAMGVVYRALDPVLNRPVAIKVMSEAVARDESLRERFLREAQAAGSLQHPNLITIYDFGDVEGHLYIAMEFVEGDDLEDLLAKRVPFSLAQKLDILVEVLTGLSYAHKRGIVHRDIKPANIRIDVEGRARIMDFGIAHITSSNMTRTGVMVGTPAYMAPEQIVGGPVSPATDIFSVGAVMYELLTNAKPFEGETLQMIMYKIVTNAPPDISTILPGLPPSLNGIVHRALAKEPSARYSNALEMANALSNARAGLPDSLPGLPPLSLRSSIEHALAGHHARIRRDKRRRAITIGAAAAGVVIVGLGAAALLMRDRGATRTVQTPSGQVVSSQPQPASRDSAAAQSPVVPVAAPVVSANTPRSTQTQSSAPPVLPKKQSSAPTTPSGQELSLFRTLQSTALQARKTAVEAGATTEQLQAGDDNNKAADALIQQGRVADAAERLDRAAAAWGVAERAARAAAAAAAASRASPPEPTKQSVPPPSASSVSPPAASAPVVQPAPTPVQQSSANAANEINAAVAAYARSIESRDLSAVRRAYRGITPAQAKSFEDFFGSIRTLRASFTVSGLEIAGSTAEARLAGLYEYVTNVGKTERQTDSFQAAFRRESGSWEIVSIRRSN